MPISLAKFQELKFNDVERYEHILDKVFVQQNLLSANEKMFGRCRHDNYEGNDLRQVKSLNEDKILFERLSLAYFHGTKTAFEKCGGRNSFSLVAGFAFDGFIDSGGHPSFTKKNKKSVKNSACII